MKSTISSAILAIASIASASAVVTRKTTLPNHVWMQKSLGPNAAQVDQICINFKSNIGQFYYTLQGPWGSGSGAGEDGGSICVPTANTGGAMFIGPDPNPGPGSTKLECYFPSDGEANCDVSIVDGYSYAVTCLIPGVNNYIGGDVDLWAMNGCPDQQGPNCINQNGYAPSQSDVDAFFQPAVNNGNNYCIWVNCGQDYYFPTGSTVTCGVDGEARG